MNPKEKTADYIRKQIIKEKDRFMSGMKNDYSNWSLFEDEFNSLSSKNEEYMYEIHLMRKYLKKKQLIHEYTEWRRKK